MKREWSMVVKSKVNKFIVKYKEDSKYGEVGDLIDSFTHPSGRVMYSLVFNDRELKGYYLDEIEPLMKLIK
ncbi:hypothetical protein NV379_01800 [Paenibacillus sp. N1-5-1-14]|uniref:hypothetical protein n=1 Tax=Paenibacillus radicibacter TaxID=2972488 RepID=UPI002158C8A1|nr:hypothetical protein [Paenibacillus radicibacter]MCR8641379.1 hypothetical protein [Paenibacillus radicibacter]